MTVIEAFFTNGFLRATLLQTTPILLAAMAGVFSQQANILNLALEGLLLIAAFTAIAIGYITQDASLAVIGAVVFSVLTSLIHAFVTLRLKADNTMVGIGINLLGSGITVFLLATLFHSRGSFSPVPFPSLPRLELDWLAEVPLLGAFDGLGILVFVAALLVPVAHITLYRTPFGLHLRAVGENAAAAEASGINVQRMQTIALAISGLFCGLAGAQLSMGTIQMFVAEMSGGRGFIALAAAVFGNGTPIGATIGALIFGASDAIATTLQIRSAIPPQLILMTPYVATLIALVWVQRRAVNRRRQALRQA